MLCQFARQFLQLVANFLERGRQFKRRLREETITDLMMVHLQNLGSDQIIVDFPDEPTTGADMEWNFVNDKPTARGGLSWRRHHPITGDGLLRLVAPQLARTV
jgi:hypothetical protein